ncbi:MAG: thioredoxin [Candidatus Competibacteraceae bacterium]|nr:thioredoxin [Candidatus Competibacteraceae bacterium]
MTNLTSETFEAFVSLDAVTLVDFWAEWCMPCRMLAPLLETLSVTYRIAKVNAEDEHELTAKHKISALPTMLFFRRGEVVGSITGLVKKDEIIKKFQELS